MAVFIDDFTTPIHAAPESRVGLRAGVASFVARRIADAATLPQRLARAQAQLVLVPDLSASARARRRGIGDQTLIKDVLAQLARRLSMELVR